MADLKQFTWDGLRPGMDLDLYLNRWPSVGKGKCDIIQTLHLKVSGEGRVAGIPFKLAVEIEMPDTSPSGKCIVKLNGDKEESAYRVVDGTLQINHSSTQISMKNNDSKWSWVHVNNPVSVWIGLWPAGVAINMEDSFGEIG
jgi:hypothetical protein